MDRRPLASLISAGGGSIIVATRQQGATYVVQAVDDSGAVIESRAYPTLRGCLP
jgi:hypothetical protein